MCSGIVEVELGGTPGWHSASGAILQWDTECTDCLVGKSCELEWLWRPALVC